MFFWSKPSIISINTTYLNSIDYLLYPETQTPIIYTYYVDKNEAMYWTVKQCYVKVTNEEDTNENACVQK